MYLVARSFPGRFDECWFDPEFWGELASPVTEGGRGSAWFVNSGAGKLVLRHFCRGGLPGRFIQRDYLFIRERAVRSFAEFRLLDELFRRGFPVPEPVAAGYRKRGLLVYQAALLMRCIAGAAPLAGFPSAQHEALWRQAGACVRCFHDAGVCHADLNCMNILVANNKVYLIDFDRGRIIAASSGERWKAANIRRLERSVQKCLIAVPADTREHLWQSFLAGYRKGQ